MAVGCADRPSVIDVNPSLPHDNVALRISATNPADLTLLRDLAATWASRNHATVVVSETVGDETADLWVVAPAELPAFAETGRLTEAPPDVMKAAQAYRWDDIFPVISSSLCGWRDKTWAVPVVGEGLVFVYRTDAFPGKAGPVPRHWDDVVQQATEAPRTCLAAWPAAPEAREAVFFSLAASLDRAVITRLPGGTLVRDDFFSFQFDPTTGASRLMSPAFLEAGEILAKLTPMTTPGADPAESFNRHGAKCGFMTLSELARLDPGVAAKVGILPTLGVTHTYDADGERVAVTGGNVNRVPYLGWGARVGVVSAKSGNPEAAWDFLTDAGMPDRQALDLIAAAKWGAGPFRASQLDARNRARWLGYQLTPAETDRLTSALRDNLGIGTLNSRTRLRTPNERELREAFRRHWEGVLAGREQPEQALRATDEEWTAAIQRIPPDQWRMWVRKALGL